MAIHEQRLALVQLYRHERLTRFVKMQRLHTTGYISASDARNQHPVLINVAR